MTRALRAVALIRMSTDKQTHSPDRQRALFADYCERYELLSVGHYDDLAVSATKTSLEDRPGIVRMMADAKRDRFEVVWVEERSRAARKLSEYAIVQDYLTKRGIVLVGINDDPHALWTDERDLTGKIEAVIAEYETKRLGTRIRRAKQVAVAEGRKTGGVGPLGIGYDREAQRYTVDEEGAAVARRIFELYAQGLNHTEIARRMVADGIPNRSGKNWSGYTIGCIVRNPAYRGRINAFGLEHEADLPQIIPPETLAAADAMLDELRARPQRKAVKIGGSDAVFSGLLRCPECGRWLSGETQRPAAWHPRTYVYYRCVNAKGIIPTCVNKRCTSQRLLEETLLPTIFRHIRGLSSRSQAPKEPPPVADSRKRREALTEARKRTIRAHTLGHIDDDDLADELEHIATEIRALDATPPPPRPITREQVQTLVGAIGKKWPTYAPADRGAILKTVIAHILLDYDDLAKSKVVWRV